MIFVPLPFVVALLLVIMLVRMVRQGEAGLEQNRYFILLMAAYALQSMLIGLRWGYDLREILPVQSVLAVIIAALAWISFRNLAVEQTGASKPLIWPHFLPAGLVLVLLVVWREPVGPLITLVFLSYGTALLWLARQGPDGLIASRLDGSVVSYRSLLVTAFWIIGSAVTDVIITLDLQWTGGAYSGAVVGYANVIALLVLGGAASMASQNQSDDEVGPTLSGGNEPQATEEDSAVAASVDALMREKHLYRDVDLNLGRIARKLNLPARRVSLAINRIHGMSVSQYVNNHRIEEARRLLTSTDEPVTRIMFDAGFLTKSNFNREFLRVTGLSPTAWRQNNCIAESLPS